MRRARGIRPQRRLIFVGCEGDHERSYVAFLNFLVDYMPGGVLYFDAVRLQPGAGDPLQLVRRACEKLRDKERTSGIGYMARGALLDYDRFPQLPEPAQQETVRLARANGIHLIWQHPCFEALLLRHLDSCHQRRPQTTTGAKAALGQEWPNYRDELSGPSLFRRISLEHVRRACTIEIQLRDFLAEIGFL